VTTAAAVSLATPAIAACGDGSDTPQPPMTARGRFATIGLEFDGNLGKVLVDSRSHPVLVAHGLRRQELSCVAACAAARPPVRAQSTSLAGAGLSAAKLTTTARFDGGPQVLYNGHPLSRFTGTPKPGDINGRRVTAFGAAWSAVSLAGQVVSRPRSKPGGGGIS
jgi:predicted lipoprotein with Yx(FWY)xxD motif